MVFSNMYIQCNKNREPTSERNEVGHPSFLRLDPDG